MADNFSKIERRNIFLLIAITVIIGFSLIGIGNMMKPEGCELLGDDAANVHTICFECKGWPQYCSDNVGNSGARVVAGLGVILVLIPFLYPLAAKIQNKRIINNEIFKNEH